MKHKTKEAISTIASFLLSFLIIYPGMLFLGLDGYHHSQGNVADTMSDKELLILGGAVVAATLVILALFRWVRR